MVVSFDAAFTDFCRRLVRDYFYAASLRRDMGRDRVPTHILQRLMPTREPVARETLLRLLRPLSVDEIHELTRQWPWPSRGPAPIGPDEILLRLSRLRDQEEKS